MKIGEQNWEQTLRDKGHALSSGFWDDFTPVPISEIAECSRIIGRNLPDDYILFLTTIGCGDFPDKFGGRIYSPEEVMEGIVGPTWMFIDRAPAMDEDILRSAYVHKAPSLLPGGSSLYGDVDIFDLVQIGNDGMGCYYQLLCRDDHQYSFGFCRVTPERTLEDRAIDFSHGIEEIIQFYEELDE